MLGRIKSYLKNGNEIEVKFDEGVLYVDLIASGTIRFHELRQRPSVAVDKLPKLNVKAEIIFEKYLTIKTSSLIIEIRNNLAIYVTNLEGTPILTPVKYRGQSKINSELLEKEGHANQGDDSYRFIFAYKMNKGQCFYGLGDKTGYLNKRGYKYINWNTDDPRPHEENWQSLYKSIPFFLGKHSDVNFGIFVDNTYSSIFDFGQDDHDSFYFGCHNGEIDFYLFYSKSMKNIISSYTLLTGRTPLPQIWTLGNQQSRWSYASRGEAEEIVDSYLKNDIPLEVIHLDIDYMEHYKIFTVSDEKFPDFKDMVSSFASKGVKVVTIIDPGIKAEEGYTIYDEGIKEDYF